MILPPNARALCYSKARHGQDECADKSWRLKFSPSLTWEAFLQEVEDVTGVSGVSGECGVFGRPSVDATSQATFGKYSEKKDMLRIYLTEKKIHGGKKIYFPVLNIRCLAASDFAPTFCCDRYPRKQSRSDNACGFHRRQGDFGYQDVVRLKVSWRKSRQDSTSESFPYNRTEAHGLTTFD